MRKKDFLSWHFYKPNDMKNQYKKIGFNINFEPYDWFIGTGEYIVDFEENVKKRGFRISFKELNKPKRLFLYH